MIIQMIVQVIIQIIQIAVTIVGDEVFAVRDELAICADRRG